MNQEPTFFDKRTMLAMAFVFVGILGWNFYLAKKYPQQIQPAAAAPTTQNESAPTQVANPTPSPKNQNEDVAPSQASNNETFYKFENEKLSFEVSSRGMGIRNVIIKSHTQRDGQPIVVGKDLSTHYIFETEGKDSQKIFFKLDTSSQGVIKGTAAVGQTTFEKTYEIDSAGHKINTNLKVTNPTFPIVTTLAENISVGKSTSFLLPSYDFESLYVAYEGTNTKVDIREDAELVLEEPVSNVSVASLGGHYFTAALVDRSPIAPTLSTKILLVPVKHAVGFLQYDFPDSNRTYELKNTSFLGPKDLKLLKSVDEQLSGVVNYGIFSWIAIPILKLLQFFYSIVGNYGVAIILVTLLIRLLLMPINISSYKSMKAMQNVQPLLKAIKEKYKNDPKRLQVETMNIMKQHKVNPLGGCLPMLMQLPIFIALYNVLAMSLELYQAPFGLWIQDLSTKDPYYVLPILMGISMYIQQKITPTALDPAQAKAMQIMPVIFSLLMITLPSGLTLYIFVSTVFGVVQQYLFMNDKKQNNAITINAK